MSTPLLEAPQLELRISAHAVLRYQERVAAVSAEVARLEIRKMITGARVRTTPPNWMVVPEFPSSRYLISADDPDVCPVVRDGTVMTIYSRSTMWEVPSDLDPRKHWCRRPLVSEDASASKTALDLTFPNHLDFIRSLTMPTSSLLRQSTVVFSTAVVIILAAGCSSKPDAATIAAPVTVTVPVTVSAAARSVTAATTVVDPHSGCR